MAKGNDIRTTLREAEAQSSGGKGHLLFGLIAFLGFAVGAAIIFFLPGLYPVKPSASVPAFQQARESAEISEPPAAARLPSPSDWSVNPEEAGKAADAVCFQRAHAAQPSLSTTPRLTTKALSDFDLKEMKHFNELMTCLLTELPVRYCAPRQRSMMTAEIITYFHGVAYLNRALDETRKLQYENRANLASDAPKIGTAEIDPRVVGGIEARLRDASLTKVELGRMNAVLPVNLRNRFAGIAPSSSKCPPPPWWAVWQK